jgi:16S rRNA (guanine527-N7)-methyltransferase
MENFRKLLSTEFAPFCELTEEQLDRLERHYQLLLRWNEKMNLTRISSLRESVLFHYCESLYLGLWLPPGPLRIADVGSGGGFPGIPIAILRPECQVDLIEANARKAVFLKEAAREQLNIRVVNIRAEVSREHYDWVVSRAVRKEDLLALKISEHIAILGSEGDALPWGENRRLLLMDVSVPRGT